MDDRLGLELGGLRGEVGVLREGVGRLADRLDAHLASDPQAQQAQRRFTAGVIIGAAGFVLSAVGVIVQLLLAA